MKPNLYWDCMLVHQLNFPSMPVCVKARRSRVYVSLPVSCFLFWDAHLCSWLSRQSLRSRWSCFSLLTRLTCVPLGSRLTVWTLAQTEEVRGF